MASIIVDSWGTRCSSFKRALMFSSIWMDIEHPAGTGYSGVGDLDDTVLQCNSWAIGSIICGRTCGEDVFYTLRILGPQALPCRARGFSPNQGAEYVIPPYTERSFFFLCVSYWVCLSSSCVCTVVSQESLRCPLVRRHIPSANDLVAPMVPLIYFLI